MGRFKRGLSLVEPLVDAFQLLALSHKLLGCGDTSLFRIGDGSESALEKKSVGRSGNSVQVAKIMGKRKRGEHKPNA